MSKESEAPTPISSPRCQLISSSAQRTGLRRAPTLIFERTGSWKYNGCA